MITKITLKNFQSHRNSEIEFTDGLNILSGQSDSGKSAIIRALNWVFTNKPSGDAFRSTWARKRPTEVSVFLDSGDVVKRVKGKSVNSYFLNDREFKAMGQSVPDEILQVLNIDTLNIQSQHDAPFLLSESSGEVARTLNRIVNLEIMDKALVECNSERLRLNREIQRYSDEIDNRFEQLKEFDILDAYERDVSDLEKKQERLQSRIEAHDKLATLLDTIDDARNASSLVIVPDDTLVESLTNAFAELAGCTVSVNQLKKYLERVRYINKQLSTIKIPNNIGELEQCINDIKTLKTENSEIRNLVRNIKDTKDGIVELDGEIRTMKRKMPETCPLCGHKIEGEF